MNDFYLELALRKSTCKTDKDGNYLFEVEASNENLDFQNQRVLQRALWESKDNFLKYGVISNDHLHHSERADGKVSSPDEIIGEPVDVRVEDGKTIVTGKLYHSNPTAQAFIRLLKDGSTRVRSSIGGIFPKVKKLADGTEVVTSVLWNDLALTSTPVNNTVGHARLVKSYTPDQFVKALQAGYETDGAEKENGGALLEEDVANAGKALNVQSECTETGCAKCGAGCDNVLEKGFELCCNKKPFSIELLLTGQVDFEGLRRLISQAKEAGGIVNSTLKERLALAELVDNLGSGTISSIEEALSFLIANGIADDKAQCYLREIENTGGCLMKKSIGARLSRIAKAFTKGVDNDAEGELDLAADEGEEEAFDGADDGLDDGEIEDGEEDYEGYNPDPDDLINLDNEDFGEEGDEELGKSRRRKSLDFEDDGDELVDGTDVLKSLARQQARIEKSLRQIGNTVATMGESIMGIGNARNPRLAKSYQGAFDGGSGYSKVPHGKPTQEDFEKVQNALQKSFSAGKIDAYESAKISSEFQRAMAGVSRLSEKTYTQLCQMMKD